MVPTIGYLEQNKGKQKNQWWTKLMINIFLIDSKMRQQAEKVFCLQSKVEMHWKGCH